MDKPRVYLETSFISYLAAQPSRDVVTVQRQISSQEWWDECRHEFELLVSPYVIAECRKGNAVLAASRQAIIAQATALPDDPRVTQIGELLVAPSGPIPRSVAPDGFHFASAAVFGCQYLLTWNFRHLANASIRRRLDNIVRRLGYEPPIICTTDELNPDQSE